jgi:hypothetical protein
MSGFHLHARCFGAHSYGQATRRLRLLFSDSHLWMRWKAAKTAAPAALEDAFTPSLLTMN